MKQYFLTAAGVLAFVGCIVLSVEILRASRLSESVVLTDSVCEPPCWNGIVPGDTDPDEAMRQLSDSETVDFGSVFERLRGGETVRIMWFFTPPSPDISGTVFFKDSVVNAISIRSARSLRLGAVLEKLGQPDSMWQHCAQTGEQSWQQVVLFWPGEGFLATIDFNERCVPLPVERLVSRMPVSSVVYFEPGKLTELIERRIIFREPPEAILAEIQPIPGLGG